ncbi:MAG: tetratricopeptide repeat protein [Chlorobi bacterium]|nr:tetratricopeptide repeat protein [Chlorobiota bacterium]
MNTLKRSIALLGFFLFSIIVTAQTVEDAGLKYNEANTAFQNKQYANAITLYKDALSMAEAAGPDADQLKGNIQTQLVNAFYKNGIALYKQKKYDESVKSLREGQSLAKSVGNNSMASKIEGIIPKIYSSKGLSLVKQKKLDDALAAFQEARTVNPKCVISFYGESIAYKDMGDMEKMKASVEKAIEYGSENPKMKKYADKAKTVAAKALLSEATKELQKEHSATAVKYFNDSFKYKPGDAEAYFYLAIAYNKLKKYDDAITAANKAIEMKQNDKSDIYFQLGLAYEGKGNTAKACSSFKKVTSGDNVEAAKYEMTQKLKCS